MCRGRNSALCGPYLWCSVPGRQTNLVTADTIQEMLEREPFEPFRVVTASGESYAVRNPHLVALLRSEVFIAHPNSDRRTFVPLRNVTAVETIRNGRASGSRRKGHR